jgi:putative ABC transport system permease protein
MDLTAALRQAMKETDPQMPLASVRPLTQVISASYQAQQFMLLMMSLFAALALVLTAVGMYGMLSYQVSQRTNEIGIRIALGARPRDVLWLVVGQGLRLTFIGMLIGLAAAYGLTRLIANLLFGVSATDPVTFVAITSMLALVALMACWIPVWRATKVNPLIAIKYE